MEMYALFSTLEKPLKLQTRGLALSDGYECEVPIPLPDMVVVFTLGSWPAELQGQMLRVQVGIEDFKPFTIGCVTEENRSFCWQGSWRDDLYIKSELMPDVSDSKGQLVLTPEPCRPITPPSCLSTPSYKYKMVVGDDDDGKLTEERTDEDCKANGVKEDEDDKMADVLGGDDDDKEEDVKETNTAISLTDVKSKQSCKKTNTSEPKTASTNRKKRKASNEATESKPKRGSSGKRPTRTRTCQPKENSAKDNVEKKPIVKRDIMSFMKAAPRPSPRWGHSLCDIGNNQALLVGGQGAKQILAKDSIWLLKTDTREWEVPDITIDSNKPHHRMGHTATFDPKVQCLYVFGGSKNLRWYNDIHVLDLDTWKWSLIKANGKAPTRAYHSSTLFRNELFIFGGVFPNADPEPDGCSNQVFVYSPETESWYEPVLLGERPKRRSGHSATLLGEKLVIFGGWDAPDCYNDLHILDLCLMEFTSPSVSGTPPSPRSWHGSIELPGNRILIHGGYDGDSALGDSFIFNLDTMSWSSVKLPNTVSERAGHSLLSLTGTQMATSSTEEEEKENTPNRNVKSTHKLMAFAGGNNDGTFFNDLIKVSLKLEDL
ncbi:uncharacterized protein [Amphiura filiformis]|uniref:uncharacterized protein n=1 Tax=Amphiura filiformis TaxID=82378 RepID=UPI003B20B90A